MESVDLYAKISVSNKREDVSVKIFNIIKGTNEPKTLMNHISCNCK